MFKHLAVVSAVALCCTAAALAQTNPQASDSLPPPSATQASVPPVDTMTCDQMQAEMTGSGQTMSHQLDPQFGVEAQAMRNDAEEKQREAQQQIAQAPANALACMIPFMCHVTQQHQQQVSQEEAARNQARMQAQMGRLNNSMTGLDQGRMQAIMNRWQAQHCQMPQQSPQH